MSHKITFTGKNEHGFVDNWGIRFVTGEPVEVTDEAVIAQAIGHPEFEVAGSRKREKAEGKPADKEELKALRVEYEAKSGKKVFTGWNAETLRAKIAAL